MMRALRMSKKPRSLLEQQPSIRAKNLKMIFDSQKRHSASEIKEVFKTSIEEAAADLVDTKNAIRRLEVKIYSIDILSWLSAQCEKNKIYWSSRDGELEV